MSPRVAVGRSTNDIRPADGAPGTIEETAALATERGETGIALRVDHTDDAQIDALFERVAEDPAGLDVLVNCAWGGYENYDHAGFSAPFWEAPFSGRWEAMFTAGVRATMATTHRALPLLLGADHGLVVNVAAWDRGRYLGALIYDTAKAAIVRFTATLAHELRSREVAVVTVFPGFSSTERVLMAGAQGASSRLNTPAGGSSPSWPIQRFSGVPAAAIGSVTWPLTTDSPTSTTVSPPRSSFQTSSSSRSDGLGDPTPLTFRSDSAMTASKRRSSGH